MPVNSAGRGRAKDGIAFPFSSLPSFLDPLYDLLFRDVVFRLVTQSFFFFIRVFFFFFTFFFCVCFSLCFYLLFIFYRFFCVCVLFFCFVLFGSFKSSVCSALEFSKLDLFTCLRIICVFLLLLLFRDFIPFFCFFFVFFDPIILFLAIFPLLLKVIPFLISYIFTDFEIGVFFCFSFV